MQYHKHLQFKENVVGLLAIGGHLKSFLLGAVGPKQDKIYVWSMKSTMDQERSQKCKHKLLVGEPVTQLVVHKASMRKYLIVGRKSGTIDLC
jgi:hypothetical protein